MKKLFSWASDTTHTNKWNRLVLTKQGAFMAASISLNDDIYHVSVFDQIPQASTMKSKFKTMEEAQLFADKELKRQGFGS